MIFLILCLIPLLDACSYLPDGYEAETYTYVKEETGDYLLIASKDTIQDKAFIFVPGGFVDPHVYLCWMEKLVTQYPELAIIQLKIPSNLAITNMGKIEKVMKKFEGIEHWVIGGHSLGGVVSVFTVYDNPDMFDGLVLLASWATENKSLQDWNGEVLSIYGSKDGLATVQEIEENKLYLPDSTVYYEIAGGNHSGFGCYGFQNGDMEAEISQDLQQDQMISSMEIYFEQLWE